MISTESLYNLSIVWAEPFYYPLGKSFGVYINSTLFANYSVLNMTYSLQKIVISYYASKGPLCLSFKMFNTTVPDAMGIVILSV